MNSSEASAYKSSLRKQLRQSLERMSGSDRRKKSAAVIRRLIKMPIFKKAVNILTYVALPEEVQTRSLILKALKMKKNVFVPRVHRPRKAIDIYRIESWTRDLKKGSYGILEPRPLACRKGKAKDLDLVIVPGLGFDRQGRRLGRGGGYFDRFLARAKRAKKVALAFREQIVREIPVGVQDVHVDRVITD